MNGQNAQPNNNNRRRFNNPFNLDPSKEDICIERKLNKDIFCPLLSMEPSFGEESEYYGMATVEPLKESFFHAIEAAIFPNATFFQISSILCYISTLLFIIILCFGLDETNQKVFLQAKLSTVDNIGSFYPNKMKKNFWEYYRLFTFHFLHFNIAQLLISIISLLFHYLFVIIDILNFLFLYLFVIIDILN